MKRATLVLTALALLVGGRDAKAGYITLDVPGASGTYAQGISGNTVVGYYYDGTGDRGFTETGGVYTTLSVPGAHTTLANGIEGNTVVGSYYDVATGEHGFLYTSDVTPTPEPSSLAVIVSGIATLAGYVGWWRRKQTRDVKVNHQGKPDRPNAARHTAVFIL